MKLVAVSVVKNEADIIEAFVRHTSSWVDRHLILDHDSTDGTREILGHLANEGVALEVFTDEAMGNLQQERSNYLTRLAVADHGAHWVLPLDADEFILGPSRAALEGALGEIVADHAATWPLLNHALTGHEDPAELNPCARVRFCELQAAPTRKIIVPRALALDPAILAGKGSHGLSRDATPVPMISLPDPFCLAHFPERSVPRIAARIVVAELQKLSRGAVHAGVDSHYRLPFQTLAANPALFAEACLRPESQLRPSPFSYLGSPLRYTRRAPEWESLACGVLPYLEKLAISHGRFVDSENAQTGRETRIRRMATQELAPITFAGREDAFSGFRAVSGLGPNEGPVSAAHLPRFRWGTAPETLLSLETVATPRRLEIEALTYSPNQVMEVLADDKPVVTHPFSRVEQRERLGADLPANCATVRIRYREALKTERDKRALAVIFLSLRVV